MKKFLCIVLAALLFLSVIACKSTKSKDSSNSDGSISSSVPIISSEPEISETESTVTSVQSSDLSSVNDTSKTNSENNTNKEKNETVSKNSKVESTISASKPAVINSSSSKVTSTQQNKNPTQSIKDIFKPFKPTAIASICNHTYSEPTCSIPMRCTKCGENDKDFTRISHTYVDHKCKCGKIYPLTSEAFVEFSGNFFAVNQVITQDVYLQTSNKNVTIYPCITLYKLISDPKLPPEKEVWVPYEGFYEQGEYFALEVTEGEVIRTKDGLKYGRCDRMTNEAILKDPNAIVETDFSEHRLIMRNQITITESGIYKTVLSDGFNDEKKDKNFKKDYMIQTY